MPGTSGNPTTLEHARQFAYPVARWGSLLWSYRCRRSSLHSTIWLKAVVRLWLNYVVWFNFWFLLLVNIHHRSLMAPLLSHIKPQLSMVRSQVASCVMCKQGWTTTCTPFMAVCSLATGSIYCRCSFYCDWRSVYEKCFAHIQSVQVVSFNVMTVHQRIDVTRDGAIHVCSWFHLQTIRFMVYVGPRFISTWQKQALKH